LLLCVGFIALVFFMLSAPEETLPAIKQEKAQEAAAKPSRIKSFRKDVALFQPAVPRWKNPQDNKEYLEDWDIKKARESQKVTFELPDGSTGEIFPTRPIYAVGQPPKLYMKLKDPSGNPLIGRASSTIVFIHTKTGEVYQTGYDERIYKGNGLYEASPPPNKVFNTPGKISIVSMVSNTETVDPNDPESLKTTSVKTTVSIGKPARLGKAVGTFTAAGLMVNVLVTGDTSKPLFVAGELLGVVSYDNYEPLGISSTTFPGGSEGSAMLEILFRDVPRDSYPNYSIGDLTLWHGEDYQLADFRQYPVKIKFTKM
jgi:hypothetical protein